MTGRVLDVATQQPLVGASVVVTGTQNGTYTNDAGRFTLNTSAGAVTLRVRRIGYKGKDVPVPAGQNEVAVSLDRDVLQLETQVITGQVTTVSSQNAANAVSSVSGQQLNEAPTPTIENALQGKIAGATISQNSGAPGGGMQVRMRGLTTILGASDPLYVVDGVIVSNDIVQGGLNAITGSAGGLNSSNQDNGVNRIADINPADIENIEILKGASASAIYGSKASNGVILITTKQGVNGRPRLNLTQRVGAFQLSNTLGSKRMNIADAIAYGAGVGMSEADVRSNYAACNGFCDHERELYGNKPLSYETSLSLNGGTNDTKYFASGLLHHDGGIANNSGYDKQSLRLNLTQNVGSRLSLQVNSNLVHSLTARSISNNDNVNITPYFVLPATPSWFDLRAKGGIYPANQFVGSNPIQTLDLVRTPEEVYRLIGSANATYQLLNSEKQSLSIRVDGGIDHLSQTDNITSPRELQFEPADGLPGTVTFQSAVIENANGSVSATHQFFPSSLPFKLTTSVGAQRIVHQLKDPNIVGQDVILGQTTISNAAAITAFDFRDLSRNLAYFGQEDILAFGERLFLSGGLRAERSTTNGDVNKLYLFPKASASYRFTNLFRGVDEMKARFAYGKAGNPPLTTSKFTPLGGLVYGGQNGVVAGGRLGKSDIKPETQTEIEGGLDFTLFNSRASLALTGYQKRITDLLLRPALAPSTGFTTVDINVGGQLRNRGFEAELGLTPIQAANGFSWISRTTFARNVGVVEHLPESVGHVQCLNAAGSAIQTNQSLCPRGFTSGAFGFQYGQGRIEEGASPTQVIGQDTIAGGVLVQRKYGDTEPDYIFGFSNEFTFRGFRVYGLFDWRKGGVAVDLTRNVYDAFGTAPDSAAAAARLDRDGNGLSAYIEPTGFVKLREISVSYQLPERWVGRLFRSSARTASIEISGRNLYTWTKYGGIDPEVSNFGNTNIVRNQDLAPFPPARSYFFSINVGF
ncbi:MAG: SusC/RagA family TonB-linked outer membrane protein [Gemmatimonadota bacterium]|nr:SusC/RagA family TonB-linked outer membrane protein [Gemmatimonadota bacterium]